MIGNEKGIVLKLHEGEIHLHPDTLTKYLNSLPRNEKGWIVLGASIKANGRSSHHIFPKTPNYSHLKKTG